MVVLVAHAWTTPYSHSFLQLRAGDAGGTKPVKRPGRCMLCTAAHRCRGL